MTYLRPDDFTKKINIIVELKYKVYSKTNNIKNNMHIMNLFIPRT